MKTSYRIEITRIDEEDVTVTKNFLVEKKPTEITEAKAYGGGREVQFEERWEPHEFTETTTEETAVLTQTVETLDLAKVIAAINGLSLNGGK